MSDAHEAEMGDDEMGEPIAELATFGSDASQGFVARFRNSVQRRKLTVQLLSFSWSAPGLVLKEFWLMLIEQPHAAKAQEGAADERKTP
jgi:hypothetical protein